MNKWYEEEVELSSFVRISSLVELLPGSQSERSYLGYYYYSYFHENF